MVGRLLVWGGGLVAVAAAAWLGVYFYLEGFKPTDTVGVIGAIAGVAGLAVAVYGAVLAGRSSTPEAPATKSTTGSGSTRNKISGGTFHGPVTQGRDISGPTFSGFAPPAKPEPEHK